MAVYNYLTKNSEGNRKEGEIRADSLDNAIQKLTTNGQMVITLKEVDEDLIRAYDVIFNGNKNIINSLNFNSEDNLARLSPQTILVLNLVKNPSSIP